MDAVAERILATYDTITVVGASGAPAKAAHYVPAYMQQHGWRIVPVNPYRDEILGQQVHRTLADVPEQVGLVDVFRPPHRAPDVARQAVAAGASALWLQLGIASAEARAIATILPVVSRHLGDPDHRAAPDGSDRAGSLTTCRVRRLGSAA